EASVRDGNLTIGFRRQMQGIHPTAPIRFDLRLRHLDALTISGSGSARSESIRTKRLKLVISGSGSVNLDRLFAAWLGTTISGPGSFQVAGEAPEHLVKISGSGGLNAQNLRTRLAEVTVSGSGTAVLDVAEKLSAEISGSGDVAFSGDAHVSQITSGSGRVRAL
ncbi:MAG: DUF2807 domain-containing protein, partial [Chloroflexota bacterium]|nr:DUF2807 domain-containing protein [Chloroflexota bacterium]